MESEQCPFDAYKLTATEECAKIPNILVAKGSKEVIDYSKGGVNSQAAIQYGYLQKPERIDKVVTASV